MTDKPIIIIGAGGHAKVVIDVAQSLGIKILFATDIDITLHGTDILGVRVAGNDECISEHLPSSVYLANGIGALANTRSRRNVFEKWAANKYTFLSLIHPRATVSTNAVIEAGAQCMAGSVIQPGARICRNSVINTGACIDHDTKISEHSFIGPGVVTGGNVVVQSDAFIGAGAVILPNISVGTNAVVGAGSVVIRNIHTNEKVVGNPTKPIRNKS